MSFDSGICMCLITKVICNSKSLWLLKMGEYRSVVSDYSVENTVGLISSEL